MNYKNMCPWKYHGIDRDWRCIREPGHEGAHRIRCESVYFDDNGNVLGFGP